MIIDCIPFFNEIDILKLRLSVLSPLVDRFVIEEATVTFSGEPKELFFEKNKEKFREFLPKITHIVVDDTPEDHTEEATFIRDYYQKNRLIEGLSDVKDDDIVIFGDADEIPDPETLQKIIESFDPEKVYHLAQRNFYVYLNNEEKSGKLLSITKEFPDIPEEKRLWLGTKVCAKKNIPAEGIVRLRDLVPVTDPRSVRVPNGGWHFGYMGGEKEKDPAKRIGIKTKAAAHQDYNESEILRETMDHLYRGEDIFGRDACFERVEINDSFPLYLREHIEEYAHLILPPVSASMKMKAGFDLTVGKTVRKIKRRILKPVYFAVKEEFDYLFRMNEKDKALVRFKRAGGEAIRFRYDIRDEDVVFDLGGYMGDWAASLPNLNCRIHIFEPVKAFSQICAKRFADRENVKCHPFGLDSRTHKAEISHEADGSSQYHDKGETEEAEFVDIEEFMDDNSIDKVKLMKLNIEGGEYDILEKLVKSGRIRCFENLQIQFHDIPEIRSEERMHALWEALSKSHRLTWAYRPYIHENWELKKDHE